MEQFLKKLEKIKQGVMLSAAHKADMRKRLVQFIEAHDAMRRVDAAPHLSQGYFTKLFMRPMPVLAGVMLVMVLGGGTSFAAQAALPGEALYQVKILSEGVRSALIFEEESKIEWETALAERRLDEAGRLAASGRLDAQLEEQLQVRFAAHAEEVKSRIAKMASGENFSAIAGLAARFEASLDAHNRILARIDANNTANNIRSSGFALNDQVAVKRDEVKDVRTAAEIKAFQSQAQESSHAAENKVETADKLLAQANIFREREDSAPLVRTFKSSEKESGASAGDSATEGEVKFNLARSILTDAKAKLAQKEYAEAFRLGNEAVRMAQEAKVLLRAQKELKIRVKVDTRESGENDAALYPEIKDREGEERSGGRFEIRAYEQAAPTGAQ